MTAGEYFGHIGSTDLLPPPTKKHPRLQDSKEIQSKVAVAKPREIYCFKKGCTALCVEKSRYCSENCALDDSEDLFDSLMIYRCSLTCRIMQIYLILFFVILTMFTETRFN